MKVLENGSGYKRGTQLERWKVNTKAVGKQKHLVEMSELEWAIGREIWLGELPQ